MGRSRVLSFMSAFGGSPRSSTSNVASSLPPKASDVQSPSTQALTSTTPRESPAPSTPPRTRTERASSRPGSMVFQPAPVEIGRDTLPELQPIFTFLNSHQNKLYQEGYFLKLNDLDTNGKPNADRNWTECFAQLVGTILSLWDAAALDAAGQDGEVAPTFINLADASIKMIKTLPTRNDEVQPLENVLSISTAGKNRYLLHFNTLHSLTQWTAGIRLTMFEHSSLQELYTGSLIAGKGKTLNNIRVIMERTKLRSEDWCRVRFGAGTPWRRCWCVITPPDEKAYQRQQKSLKKASAYERPPLPKGDVKFYDTKKTKKVTPIATITDAYSAYAIYPHSKPLIEASTMVKVEGRIRIHSRPESETEGFVFVMPEVHPAVSGFEMMLRWLFPVYDTFCLYGRPTRLIADTLDPRGIMFAMPTRRRYGYLEIFDVATLIHTDGSQDWSEREWRKKMKDLSAKRMANTPSRGGSRIGSRKGHRNTIYGSVQYDDNSSLRSTPSARNSYSQSTDAVFAPPQKSRTGPPGMLPAHNYHARSVSETAAFSGASRRHQDPSNSRPSLEYEHDMPEILESPPVPPAHRIPFSTTGVASNFQETEGSSGRNSAESDRKAQASGSKPREISGDMRPSSPPGPVAAPPNFSHQANDKPNIRPRPAPELLRATSRMSTATLSQLADASKTGVSGVGVAAAGAAAAWKTREHSRPSAELINRGVNDSTTASRMPADQAFSTQETTAGLNDAESLRGPPVPTHRALAPTQVSANPGIARKPLPGATRSPLDGMTLSTKLSSQPAVETDRSVGVSQEQDDSRSSSPDYASTRPSTETKRSEKSVYRQRTGVLKTVGKAENGSRGSALGDPQDGKGKLDSDGIPSVDFGPTHALNPDIVQRPRTAAGFERASHDTSSFSGNDAGLAGRLDFKERPITHSRSTSGNVIPWQPGSSIGHQSPGSRAMTPEEFVSERALPGRTGTPIYAHGRNKSSGNLPFRPSSGDWSKRKEVPQRPVSRVSMSPLPSSDPNAKDYSGRLSAQEQEHVARMTGSPFFNLSSNQPATQPGASGLVGAIEAREREKKAMKDGLSGQMVQQAIYQRQQQAQQAAQAAYGPYQQPTTSQYGGPALGGPWNQSQQFYSPQRPNSRADIYWAGMQSQLDRINSGTLGNPNQQTQWSPQLHDGQLHGHQNPPSR